MGWGVGHTCVARGERGQEFDKFERGKAKFVIKWDFNVEIKDDKISVRRTLFTKYLINKDSKTLTYSFVLLISFFFLIYIT